MHLRYFLNSEGKRVYTMKNVLTDGSYTLNAHPGNHLFYDEGINFAFSTIFTR